jgi:hypothetical protein
MTPPSSGSPDSRRRNVRLGWILATIALAFALGFVARMAWFGH